MTASRPALRRPPPESRPWLATRGGQDRLRRDGDERSPDLGCWVRCQPHPTPVRDRRGPLIAGAVCRVAEVPRRATSAEPCDGSRPADRGRAGAAARRPVSSGEAAASLLAVRPAGPHDHRDRGVGGAGERRTYWGGLLGGRVCAGQRRGGDFFPSSLVGNPSRLVGKTAIETTCGDAASCLVVSMAGFPAGTPPGGAPAPDDETCRTVCRAPAAARARQEPQGGPAVPTARPRERQRPRRVGARRGRSRCVTTRTTVPAEADNVAGWTHS